jgi:uncharacterized membrane-anchored protein YjiN (DUF445 family)
MKKSQPKIILNLSLENEELEQRIKIAVDEYMEKVIEKELQADIQKAVDRVIARILKNDRWDTGSRIAGSYTLGEYIEKEVRAKTAQIAQTAIQKVVAESIAKTFTSGAI